MSKKDVFWFKHDSNASRDLKLMKIRVIYDFWGIGVFWAVIEFLREQKEYKYEYSESNMQLLCDIIGCKDLVKFNNLIDESIKVGLFCVEENQFFSVSLVERMCKWESCKTNGSVGGRVSKNTNVSETEANRKRNGSEMEAKRKRNGSEMEALREEKNREEEKKNIIDEIFNLYPTKCKISKRSLGKNKNDKTKIEKLLKEYSPEQLKLIIERYVNDCVQTKTFLKGFGTFLNNLPIDFLNIDSVTVIPFNEQREKTYDDLRKYYNEVYKDFIKIARSDLWYNNLICKDQPPTNQMVENGIPFRRITKHEDILHLIILEILKIAEVNDEMLNKKHPSAEEWNALIKKSYDWRYETGYIYKNVLEEFKTKWQYSKSIYQAFDFIIESKKIGTNV